MAYTTLISAEQLLEILNDPALVMVDCRASLADPRAGHAAYRAAHIPGAVFADLLGDLSGPITPGQTGRHPLPVVEDWLRTLRRWGVDDESQVVAYDDAGGAFAARLWWLLRFIGHEAAAVLDGGWQAWVDAPRPVSTLEARSRQQGELSLRLRPELLASADDVLRVVSGAPGILLDARAPERYRGDVEPIDPVAGRIPGALNLPFAANLEAGRFKTKAELHGRFESVLGPTLTRDPSAAIAYCGSGVTACHTLLAAAYAGLPMPRLYAGSWSEWITDPSRPIERA